MLALHRLLLDNDNDDDEELHPSPNDVFSMVCSKWQRI